ncbi:unnamed protein product [Diplocarpon coronariae]
MYAPPNDRRRIVSQCIQSNVYIGSESKDVSPSSSSSTAKHTPLSLLIVTELNGGNRRALTYLVGALLALRIAHAAAGLLVQGRFGDGGLGRPVGHFGSVGVLAALAGYAGWLVKGYWGLWLRKHVEGLTTRSKSASTDISETWVQGLDPNAASYLGSIEPGSRSKLVSMHWNRDRLLARISYDVLLFSDLEPHWISSKYPKLARAVRP